VAGHGRLDVLVALLNFRREGMLSFRRSLPRLTVGEWDRAMSRHLSSGFYIAQAALTHMIAAGGGRIVFVLGPAGVGDAQGLFASTRAGLGALCRELAVDVGGDGVTVNTVSTGLIVDEILEELPEEAARAALRRIPVGRAAEPSEVARVVAFLADPGSGYLTGQSIAVDGGLSAGLV
jgi:NAD(P)-dependent dehydrogenase (short-subunit alcohol dehydrogenase family)